MSCFMLVPLKCHHCYHKFTVPWFLTIGKRLTPPPQRGVPAAPLMARAEYQTTSSVQQAAKARKAA